MTIASEVSGGEGDQSTPNGWSRMKGELSPCATRAFPRGTHINTHKKKGGEEGLFASKLTEHMRHVAVTILGQQGRRSIGAA